MTQQAHLSDAFPLANGVAIPCLGYGTWRMQDGAETVAAIQTALSLGYRHIDTAAYYRNEASVGQALRASGLPREAVFLTSKVWVQDAGYDDTLRAFEHSRKALGLDYIDLYLIHQPFGDYYGAWRAMERLYREGAVRAIGVSNFPPERLVDLCMNQEIKPMVNQIEIHPFSSRTPPCGSWRTMGSCPRRGAPSPRRRKTFSTTRR